MAQEPTVEAIDARVMAIVETAIDEMGGPTEMVRHRDQAILPALVESAYVLVLREEAHQSDDEIAAFLGISPGAVDSVFQAPMESHLARMHQRQDIQPEFERHTDPDWSGQPETGRQEPEFVAGAIAKFAYSVVNRRRARAH